MKIHILSDFKDGPCGGGNQFLKALRNEFLEQNHYEHDPFQADVILFNSHHNLKNVFRLEKKYPGKIFVHRVDGPMSYRGKSGDKLDKQIFRVNSLIADGTVFQSEWSRRESYKKGMKINNFEVVIHNAPDPQKFSPPKQKEPIGEKIKLIATSWSNNPNKGFDIYHFLDENLDFEKYEMTFVGNIDKPFKNINVIAPLPSSELAEQLCQHDIFIFASKIEACSNSLLEGLHCGLPAVARRLSSNPEVLGGNGLLFDNFENIIDKINSVSRNLVEYKKNLSLNDIEFIGKKYKNFFDMISIQFKNNNNNPPPINFYDRIRLGELF